MKDNKEYGLVLAGGGTKGAYQVGVWKALKELNINIKAIVGASIGALNGALMVQGDIEKLEKLYKNIKIDNIMEVSNGIDSNKDIFDIKNISTLILDYQKQKGIANTPLRELLRKNLNINKLYKSDIDFGLITFSVKGKKPLEVFKKDIPKTEMIDYLLASSCFPIFKAQKIEGQEYMDGGLYDNNPINMLVEKGYKNIIVVDVSGIGFSRKMINKNVYVKVISPSENLGGTFEFNHEKIEDNITLGYLDAMKKFNQLQGHIYYFKAKEFNKMLQVFNLQTIYGLEYSARIYGIDQHKEYEFDEFISILKTKHISAQKEYEKAKKKYGLKNIFEIKNQIFDKGLGLCMMTDFYTDKPVSRVNDYLKFFLKDYMNAVTAMLEIMNN